MTARGLRAQFLRSIMEGRRRSPEDVFVAARPGVRAWLVGCALLLLLVAATAEAQNLNISLFSPTPGPFGLINLDSARPLPHLTLYTSIYGQYANDEFLARLDGEVVSRPVQHRIGAELALGMALFERLDLSLSLPINIRMLGERYPGYSDENSDTGLGDLRLIPKVILVRNRCQGGVGLALMATATAPVGSGEADFMRERGFTFVPRAALDYCRPGGLVVALNAGYKMRRANKVASFAIDDEVLLGLGTEVPLGRLSLSLLGEIVASFGLGQDDLNPDRLDEKKIPVEALAAARWRHASGVVLTAGTGMGLTAGYGAPDVRVFLGIGYSVNLSPSDANTSKEPKAPEAAPTVSADKTGPSREVPATVPELPPPPATGAPRPPSGELLNAAAEEIDPDGDGLALPQDRCPMAPEDRDDFEDEDGCPDPDNDQDGVPDGTDRCPGEKETVNGVEDDDGCPDQGTARVAVTATKVEITERVFFETGSDQLKVESTALLREVAAALKADWQIRRVLVEGHTDDRGDKEMNVDLSERRARRVMSFLVENGVAAHRLDAKGYGPTRPVHSNRTADGRARNRRVEFLILERATGSQGGAP